MRAWLKTYGIRALQAVWYAAFLVALGWLLTQRWEHIAGSTPTTLDSLLIGLLAVLLAAPLFTEISIAGISVKREVAKIKGDVEGVKGSVDSVRSEVATIRMAIQATSNSTVNVNTGPAPDAVLALIRAGFDEIAKRIPAQTGGTAPPPTSPIESDAHREEATKMFQIRYEIESHLRRLYVGLTTPDERSLADAIGNRYQSPMSYLQRLVGAQVVPTNIEPVIRQLWAITSVAIHGRPLSGEQTSFVDEVATSVVAILRGTPTPRRDQSFAFFVPPTP